MKSDADESIWDGDSKIDYAFEKVIVPPKDGVLFLKMYKALIRVLEATNLIVMR